MAHSPESSSRARDLEQREADILSKHLDPQYTGSYDEGSPLRAEPDVSLGPSRSTDNPDQLSSLRLQGGDIHRDLYRIEAKAKHPHRRTNTFSYIPRDSEDSIEDGAAANEPGNFRRHFLRQRHELDPETVPSSFLDFLDLYGSFAGEDLAESEDESAITDQEEGQPGERRPLLGRRKSARAARRGDASNIRTFFTLLKAFVGAGIIFLPRAFRNGGILFSSITLVTVAAVSTLCFHLLLQCRAKYGGGYGDIGEQISGPRIRTLILGSVAISQLGFVCAAMIFTAENLQAVFEAVAIPAGMFGSTTSLILIQLFVLIPLAFIRNISKLGPSALLADVFILFGLGYIYYYDIASIASRRGLHPTVELFNPNSFTLTIGSSIFTFEGIGLILPIQASMKRPQNFDMLLYTVMTIITILFTAAGALSYGTFGVDTKTEILSNFPQADRLVNTVQFLYSLAILVGTPVQLFPAVRIIEGKLFGLASGKGDPSIKWKKNVFRTFVVLCCAVIAAAGAGDLDKFVSLIGSFACVPLVYIYPAYLHWKGVAESRWVKYGDLTMAGVGFFFMVYTTVATVSVWIHGENP
ncbi:putative amino acid transporter [Aspergillus ruber CBS 135680]|uniref:Putative amino acid transporter n=1 Tax=Aspergillus ruber (strain CBS 135680) TaxID=1388766 RepID=A0A017S9Z3_ASPRC|nr:putative amino acid transporter [Aspergillus ruber CBS 135680]EYE93757.1 putative amino acid transporter [Aspergillus ruber CBS 135680]